MRAVRSYRNMFSFFTEHEFMPCEDCGASVARAERPSHVCDEKRRGPYELFRPVPPGGAGLEEELPGYLMTPPGRLHPPAAARDRRRPAPGAAAPPSHH